MRFKCVRIVKNIETILTFQKLESYKRCVNETLTVNVYQDALVLFEINHKL